MDRMSSNQNSDSSKGSIFSSMLHTISTNRYTTMTAIVSLIFFILSFYYADHYRHSEKGDPWQQIQRNVAAKILPLSLVGFITMFIAYAMYILQDPHKTMYSLLLLGCLTFGLSYSALLISVMAK